MVRAPTAARMTSGSEILKDQQHVVRPMTALNPTELDMLRTSQGIVYAKGCRDNRLRSPYVDRTHDFLMLVSPASRVTSSAEAPMRVSFFVTCLGDRFFAEAAADAVRLLRSLDVDVDFPRNQTCCGQPAWNAGHVPQAREMAAHTAAVFADADYLVLPSGSCTAMLRRTYPRLLESPAVADRSYELAEFLVDVLGVTELGRGLEGRRLAYHHGCHALRELGVAEQPMRLLESAGADVVPWEMDQECCGFGGLFSVKNPEVSVAMADRKLDTLPHVETVVSADGGCLLQLEGRARRRRMRLRFRSLASVLWEARRGNE